MRNPHGTTLIDEYSTKCPSIKSVPELGKNNIDGKKDGGVSITVSPATGLPSTLVETVVIVVDTPAKASSVVVSK
jgi:predicted nucleotide-binding protein (sugar kinase/HSP70/actin superfamily)